MASSMPYSAVNLNENDVPGSKFIYEDIGKHSVVQLKRWLQCRGLSFKGKKEDLVERCKNVVAQGNAKISNTVDNGSVLASKVNANRAKILSVIQTNKPPTFPVNGWKAFPSISIPKQFSYHNIYHHLVASATSLLISDQQPTLSDSDNEDIGIDGHTSKPLKKGRIYFASGNVLYIKDKLINNGEEYYCIKAEVMSSYHIKTTYTVLIMLSNCGKVVDASCHCKASAMSRCNHVAALLFALEDYINLFGYEPVSRTSKLCAWNQGRKSKRDPTEISQANYNKKKKDERPNFEPRPEELIRTTMDDQRVNALLVNMQATTVAENLKFPCMWEQLLQIVYSDYDLTTPELRLLAEKVNFFNKEILCDKESQVPFVVADTMDQSKSDKWKSLRCFRVTASKCRDVYSRMICTGINLKPTFNLVKGILWPEKFIQTRAMTYGIKNEDKALKEYEKWLKEKTSPLGVTIEKTGLWENPKYPGLAASPDGLVKDLVAQPNEGIVEIKCPKILENIKPEEIDQLKPSQKNSFCCSLKNNKLVLKQNNRYYYQMQMQMAITEREWCDFVVWSPKGISIERVSFDENLWQEISTKLIEFHRGILIPEFFEQRIPRKLMPFDLRKHVKNGELII